MQNETLLASAVKVTAVNTGAAVSMISNTGAISAVAGVLAATYSAVQIVKALPWLTDYVVAVRSGMRGDWSHWRSIAKREEKSNGIDAK
jgi:hypothetical protein